jgi:succinate dehydrogenase hydrophobic anchor subunit
VLLVAGLLVPIPYFVLLRDLFKIATERADLTARVRVAVTACLLAPLALMLVGFDTLRWVSFVCLNCSLVIFMLVRVDSSGAVEMAVSDYMRSARFAVLALLSLALGPLHVVEGNGIMTGIRAAAHGLGLLGP